MRISPSLWWALIAIVITQALLWYVRDAWARYQAGRRARSSARGERRAETLLTRSGYRILERQVAQPFVIRVDGEVLRVMLRADLLVAKGRRMFVAEVKTGPVASTLMCAETRRQLLEYRVAYPCDGVLLVDMERGRIHEVLFPIDEAAINAA